MYSIFFSLTNEFEFEYSTSGNAGSFISIQTNITLDSSSGSYTFHLPPGPYFVELWGSEGETRLNAGKPGKGGYASGYFSPAEEVTAVFSLGIGGGNSGANGFPGGRGGGATAMFIDSWPILVAGGGGGGGGSALYSINPLDFSKFPDFTTVANFNNNLVTSLFGGASGNVLFTARTGGNGGNAGMAGNNGQSSAISPSGGSPGGQSQGGAGGTIGDRMITSNQQYEFYTVGAGGGGGGGYYGGGGGGGGYLNGGTIHEYGTAGTAGSFRNGGAGGDAPNYIFVGSEYPASAGGGGGGSSYASESHFKNPSLLSSNFPSVISWATENGHSGSGYVRVTSILPNSHDSCTEPGQFLFKGSIASILLITFGSLNFFFSE